MIGTIHVCKSCQGRKVVQRGAQGDIDLLAAIAARVREMPGGVAFQVVPQACFGPCGPEVRVAVTGPGRWGWLFQGLRPGVDLDAFVTFLAAWRASEEGLPAKADRVALLRKTVGRIPPSDRARAG